MPILKSWPAAAPSAALRPLALILVLIVAATLVAGCTSSDSGRGVLITADDGLVLRGKVYGSGAAGVILAHELDGDKSGWSDFAERLAGRGFFVLTFDFRGHGDSLGRARRASPTPTWPRPCGTSEPPASLAAPTSSLLARAWAGPPP